jgi:hypothetical protein
MNLSREFSCEVDGQIIMFLVTYNPQTHTFRVVENGQREYELIFDLNSRTWETKGDFSSSLPLDTLAELVQKSFGVFV